MSNNKKTQVATDADLAVAWEEKPLTVDDKEYLLGLSNQSIRNAETMYPFNQFSSKGIQQQAAEMLHIFMMKNHPFVNYKRCKEIIDNVDLDDFSPVLEWCIERYSIAITTVFTPEGKKKKIAF